MQEEWVTGDCWLGCGRTGLLVIWLGPVQWDGQHAPFMACGDCLTRLKAQALAYFMQRQPATGNEGRATAGQTATGPTAASRARTDRAVSAAAPPPAHVPTRAVMA